MDKKVLIVEDDTFLRELYHEMLSDSGYEVEVALDGEEGLSKMNEAKFDLILLDIMMPKKDGLQVLKEATDENKKKIVMLTNLGQDQVIKNALSLGARGYLIKSEFAPDEVEAKVRDFISEQQA
ncbi:response regulator [candidate division WWE3 bacterium]|uniref:Response regulator n=1 Tax=candidate division WWE3 bacterium TaxID=2053526 RepID=A0A955RQ70_UNCKA|nr:response regulator [candidate division WWE3 bacterium]